MSSKLFSSPTEIFEEQLNDIFLHSTEDKNNLILESLSLLLRMPSSNKDLIDLYNLLGLEGFVSVMTLFENRTITFPSKHEVKELILTALIFYYREVENLSWEEIKNKIPFEFSSISYSIKIKKLNKFLSDKLYELFTEEEENE